MRILLIEDDARLADRTAEYLRHHDAEVDIVGDGQLGLERAQAGQHDIVLLDLMLPKMDGLELCKELRQRSQVPVIMLTARGEEIDRVVGLELGADDYVPKPFSARELLARIRAVLRRHHASGGHRQSPLAVGPLVIDRDRRTASCHGRQLELTAHQFDLLWALSDAAGRVLTRKELYCRVHELRGEDAGDFDPSIDRSIDVHLSKVRQALAGEHPNADQMIRTVRGVGYILEPDDG